MEAQRLAALSAFRNNIGNYTATEPLNALKLIHQDPLSGQLTAAERAALTQKAEQNLLAKLRDISDPWQALQQTRTTASTPIGSMKGRDFVAKLNNLEAEFMRRCLHVSLQSAFKFGEQGKWTEAGVEAAKGVERLRAPEADTKELTAFVKVSEHSGNLERVAQVLEKPKAGDAVWAKVPLNHLSEPLAVDVRGLKGLEGLRLASKGGQTKLDVKLLKAMAADLQAASGNADLPTKILTELSGHAFLQGDVAKARLLLPEEVLPEHAAAQLRDLKVLILGEEEGTLQTHVADGILGAQNNPGGPGNRGPPPGVAPLIPEGEAGGWRPPVRESVLNDLPPHEEAVAQLEPTLRTQAKKHVQQERLILHQAQQHTLVQARSIIQPGNQQASNQSKESDEESNFISRVQLELGRVLTPSERVTVRQMRRQGMTAAQIAVALR
jgi:hypothetical protein